MIFKITLSENRRNTRNERMKPHIFKVLLLFSVLFALLIVTPFRSSAACSTGCILVNSDLSMTPCVEYQGVAYTFKLKFSQDGSDLLWKMDASTFKQSQSGAANCIPIGSDLAIKVCCADLMNYTYSFTLNYVSDLTWKMDTTTFTGTPGDPLFPFQWHIRNTGQTTFSTGAGTPGEDLHMTQSMASRLTGAGIIMAILDEGLEIAHEDLKANIIPNGSYNFLNGTTDPTYAKTSGDHGTSVAGIAAAVAMNGVGGRGVAPNASLKGFNILSAQTTENFVMSMGGNGNVPSQNVDIFNMSYGDDVLYYNPLADSLRNLFTNTSPTLRGGKGAIYVKSSGNGFQSMDIKAGQTTYTYRCTDQKYGRSDLTCQNADADEEQSRPEVITVGAYNANGVRASYSTAGSNLWVCAPGGESGVTAPGILTTDASGCNRGYSQKNLTDPANSFETGDVTYNPNCNYTSTFDGTSAAAPAASGAIALILQANPNLYRRDVKYILAKTARKIDPNSPGSLVTVSINGSNYIASQGWITNAAGFNFNNWYGFGAIDVDAAVALAKIYQANSLPSLSDKTYGATFDPVPIPDNSAAGVTKTIDAPDNMTIENLMVMVATDHPDTREVGIEITSPSGTRSILLNLYSAVQTGLNAANGVLFSSNAFFGEKSKGIWTLKVVDGWPGNTGSLELFNLRILGY